MQRSPQQQEGSFNLRTLLNFHDISLKTQSHLRNVYLLLSATLLVAVLGTCFSIWLELASNFLAFLNVILSIGLCIFISGSAGNSHLQGRRIGAILAVAFLQGISIGPLVNLAIEIDPRLILIAFSTTVVIFASFSGAALFSRRRSFLFLGGILGSTISLFLIGHLFAFFIRSLAPLLFRFELYLGLIVFSLFVIYDTQMIVEKAELNDFDFVQHSLELFIDFIAIFVRILIILLRRDNDNNNSERRNKKK